MVLSYQHHLNTLISIKGESEMYFSDIYQSTQ